MIEIDKELCIKCQKCVDICPSRIFKLINEEAIGVEFEEYCIFCGHCLAICPRDAIRHDKFNHLQFPKIKETKIDPKDLYSLFHTRRSIRKFTKEPISRNLIKKFIDEARYAPTGSNLQNVKYFILQNQAISPFVSEVRDFYVKILELFQSSQSETTNSTIARRMRKWNYWVTEAEKGNDAIFYDPSAIIIVCAPSSDSLAPLNIGFAVAYLMLAAHANGIGTCNIGYAVEAIKRKPEIAEKFGITDDYMVGAVLSMGYPEFEFKRVPLRNPPSITWKTEELI
jgi:nitroreductase/NAD-dependent dihydropyrimidine dehydrogenase PreA subunit